ncbi:MAG: hypothetical protein WKG06_00370 [Segetibacter sp.]
MARFSEAGLQDELENQRIETYQADLLDDQQLQNLPDAENVLFLAGTKFGTTGKESLTWAMNTYLPGRVAQKYKDLANHSFFNRQCLSLNTCSIGRSR